MNTYIIYYIKIRINALDKIVSKGQTVRHSSVSRVPRDLGYPVSVAADPGEDGGRLPPAVAAPE